MAKSWQKTPEVGDKFWQEGKGSGSVTGVDYANNIVYVTFFEKGREIYEFDEVFGQWTEDYGGTWMIYLQ